MSAKGGCRRPRMPASGYEGVSMDSYSELRSCTLDVRAADRPVIGQELTCLVLRQRPG